MISSWRSAPSAGGCAAPGRVPINLLAKLFPPLSTCQAVQDKTHTTSSHMV
jgi:hypothetical protein